MRIGPRQLLRLKNPAIAVDDGGDAHVDAARDGAAALDGAESADGQVLVVFAGAVEPAIVGDVEQKIRRCLAVAAAIGTSHLRVGVLVADKDAEGETPARRRIDERQARVLLARPDAVIEIVGSEIVHPRQPIAERHVFAERHAMDLVVASGGFAVAIDQDGRVVAAFVPAIRIDAGSVHAHQQIAVPACGHVLGHLSGADARPVRSSSSHS